MLLVEDDLDLASVLGELFAQRGLELHHAESGRQAVELAQRLNPDLMLLDLGLPDTDGFRVVDWLRRHDRLRRMPPPIAGLDGPTTFEHLQADPATRDIPVLLLTAKVQIADRARFDSLGVTDVLSKPFDPMRLGADVAEALGWAA